MTHDMTPLCLTGARILRDDQITHGDISVTTNILPTTAGPALDLSGYLVLPGIIDLHGDAFERHIAPRPSAPFPLATGLEATDKDAAANGITTAWLAVSWSWEGGTRGPDAAEQILQAHQTYQPQALTDLHIQIRCETHTIETRDQLITAIGAYGVKYVVFNNHLDEAVALSRSDPGQIITWAKRAGRTPDEHMALVHSLMARSKDVPRYLCQLATAFDTLGVRYGSHDDPDAITRERYAMIGAKICEFPTHAGAAAAAQAWSDPVIMGAPNIVRGGSQSGNIAASQLIRAGHCDALVSDYHYPSLAQAAFRLVDDGLADLAGAWAMISSRPAHILGLSDRGTLDAGKRADLTLINENTRRIEGTLVAGRWSYVSGGLAHRLANLRPALRLAAE